jgi:hypothetical protein
MALEDRIQTLNWKSNFETIQNTSINGKNYITDYGHQFWSFTIQTVPLTREQFQTDFAVLFNDIDGGAKINIKAPKLNDAEGRVGFTDPSTLGTQTGSGVGGGGPLTTRIEIDLLDNSTAGMSLTFGDFVQFGNHNKIYMVNGNASLDPDDYGGAPVAGEFSITPPLIKQVSGANNIYFNNLEVTVIGIGETSEYATDQDGYFIFEKEVREVV